MKIPKSIYVTASEISPAGHGGSAVSYHELKALSEVSDVQQVLKHIRGLEIDALYPGNPFMFDHFLSTLIKHGCGIQAAHFFGGGFPSCITRLENAIITITITGESRNLITEEEERYFYAPGDIYGDFYWVREKHHTNEHMFKYLGSGVKLAKKIITPSTNNKPNLLEYGLGIKEENIVVIPLGTDIPPVTTPRDIPFKVLHFGSVGGAKGHRYLAKAWKDIYTKINGNLVFAGVGTENIRSDWLVPDPSSVKKHRCLGQISEEIKSAEFLSTSVYVQPSVNEGWGIPVGEAMAHGIPVIVTNETGAADMVTDGVDGFIIPIRDPEAISDKILYFYDNPNEIKRMGDNARRKALEYSWDKIEEKYKKFWTKLYSEERL